MIKPYAQGGLNMVDVEKFISSLKASWIKRIHSQDSKWVSLLEAECPEITNISILGGECVNPSRLKYKNPFWIDVFNAYREFVDKCGPMTKTEFKGEPVFYNKNIKIDKKSVMLKSWFENGILNIQNLCKCNGEYLSYTEFKAKYPQVKSNYQEFHGLLGAIREYSVKLRLEQFEQDNTANNTNFQLSVAWSLLLKNEKCSKVIYGKILQTSGELKCVNKWKSDFSDLDWDTIFAKIYSSTMDTNLRWLQYKIASRIVNTKKNLFVMKIKYGNLCSFCNAYPETIQHLFFECVNVNMQVLETSL